MKGQLILQFPAWIPYLLLKISDRFPTPTQSLAPLTGVSRVRKPRMNRAHPFCPKRGGEPFPSNCQRDTGCQGLWTLLLTIYFNKETLSQPKDVRAVSVVFFDPQFNSEIVQVLLLLKKKLRIPLRQETQDLKALQMEAFVEKDKQVSWITHRLATFR